MKRRIIYLALAAILFALLVLIATRWSGHTFIRGFLGDVLVVVFLYTLVRACVDAHGARIACGVFAFACGIETLQYFHLADSLSLAKGSLGRIVLGATFDPLDILAYAVGCGAAYLVDARIVSRLLKTGEPRA